MKPRGVFVTAKGFIAESAAGGVQLCTREYVRVLEGAGVELEIVTFEFDQRLSTRAARQVNSSPYFRPFAPDLPDRVLAAAREADFVFLNQVTLAGLAAKLRGSLPAGCRIVLLSHGAEITDLAHAARVRRYAPLSARMRPTPSIALGLVLADERNAREEIDLVVNLSSFDRDLEHWFGVRQSIWLPRIVEPAPLAPEVAAGRLGFVGTLDHAPNLEGLVLVLEALEAIQAPVEARIVSGSHEVARWLAARFPAVTILGALDDMALQEEARSWTGFLHPIFCAARGCSTKLAQAMAWGCPIVTTPEGRRGYRWRDGGLLEADTPRAFADLCVGLLRPDARARAAEAVQAAARTSPTLAEVAAEMRRGLGLAAAGQATSDHPA